MIDRLEQAGLGYRVRADQTRDKLGKKYQCSYYKLLLLLKLVSIALCDPSLP